MHDEIRLTLAPYVAKLDAFTTPAEIRDFLVAEGIKGRRNTPFTCAIAQYLTRDTHLGVMVQPYSISVIGWSDSFRNTDAMEAFIRAFDHGQYPELVVD